MDIAITEARVREELARVQDPELGHDIVKLGLVREVELEGDQVFIHVVPTSSNCPFSAEITRRIESAIAPLPGVGKVTVEWGSDSGS